MKKLLLLLFVFPLFLSCSSDDEDSLNGTTWEANEVDGTFIYKMTFKFQKSTFNYSGYEDWDGKIIDISGVGTYTYDHPNVILTFESGDREYGVISGSKMEIKESGDVFEKK